MLPQASKEVLFQSVPFKEVLSEVRLKLHPARIRLADNSTMEHRAIQQLRVEEFEKVISIFEKLGEDHAIKHVSSTYGVQELPPQPIP